MEEQQNQKGQQETIIEQPKKNAIPTRLGSLIVLLAATIAGTSLWWYMDSYTPPEVVDVSEIVEKLQEKREAKNELPEGYEIKDDGIYYQDKFIVGIDPETFAYLGGANETTLYSYVSDADNVYFFDKKTGEATVVTTDTQNFTYLYRGLAIDSETVYFLNSDALHVIQELDPMSIEYVAEKLLKDKNGVYIIQAENFVLQEKLDVDSFSIIVQRTIGPGYGRYYVKDKNAIYEYDSRNTSFVVHEEIDAGSFESLSKYHFKDKNYVYSFLGGYEGMVVIEDADPQSFVVSSGKYGKDRESVFYENKKMTGSDPASFCLYTEEGSLVTAKDNNFKYVDYIKTTDISVSDLDLLPNQGGARYYKDETYVYEKIYDRYTNSGTLLVIDWLDVNSTVILGYCFYMEGTGNYHEHYIKDKNGVYCGNQLIKEADPNTFEVLGSVSELGYGSITYSRDSNYVFEAGSVLAGEDPVTFEVPEELVIDACLASGTKITMADGSYKNIENIKVGDPVTSYKVETKEHTTSKVDKVIKRKDPLVIINNTLRAAPDEPVYLADGSIKQSIDIKIGDYLLNEKGEQVKVNTVEQNTELVDTYDFTLENGDNFFADGYLVRTPDL